MSKRATKQDIDDVLTEVRNLANMTHTEFVRVFAYLDVISNRIDISDSKRTTMGHQLGFLADKIGVELEA